MTKKKIKFGQALTAFYFDATFKDLQTIAGGSRIIAITDTHVWEAHRKKFARMETIVIPAGEQHKTQQTADSIIVQLTEKNADRSTLLVGVGGGVVTDITGYVAAIYLRGIKVGFVPTTILAMVDAAIGGKNGVDVGLYKNIVGTIRQPAFLLYDYSLLKTLPHAEWINGFAEVIKHAAIKDAGMFRLLKATNIIKLQKQKAALHQLIMRNALIKIKVVQADEFEQGDRKLLNFGHTLGHAIENMLQLPHGYAVSIGMVYAAHLSQQLLRYKGMAQLIELLEQYELPTHAAFNMQDALQNLVMDKKRLNNTLHFVLIRRNGKAEVCPIALDELNNLLLNI
ncbi:MAG: 3-dehydroquinate synthase [Chitinophagaceae bacterium]|jgi:3-dehydroquinate synthase|nr:3-dehydroquinate synthase [Chitinophagaceae bacterium]